MKAIIFFEGKEVCQVEYDRVTNFAGQLDFFMGKEMIAFFAKGHSYLVIAEKIPLTEAEILEWKAKITHATEKLKVKWWQF